jgi:hypothetical protein
MADIKISAFPVFSGTITDTDQITNGLTDVLTTPSNVNFQMSQVAQYVSNYIASLTRTVNVGVGVQYEYPNVTQAWNALGSPLNVHVCTDIVEDGDILLNAANSYLSITHAYNVVVDRGDYQIIASNVSRVTLKIDGAFSIWRRGYGSNKSSIDFKTRVPDVMIIEIVDLIDDDQSGHSFGTPFIAQAQPNFGGFCYMRNVTLQLNNNAISTNELIDASIENIFLVCNDGRDSDFVLDIKGNSKVNGVKAIGDFRATTTLMTINKYSTYENVWNLASGQVAIVTSGGNGSNLYGVNSLLNVTMLGDEVAAIYPKVVNANNCNYTFREGTTANNSCGSISNSDVMGTDNTGLKNGNFRFSNCQIPQQLTWAGDTELVQFSNCNFQTGYTIDNKNMILVNVLAGLSSNTGGENITVDTASGGDGATVVAVKGNSDFNDPTISTDNVQQGFNQRII